MKAGTTAGWIAWVFATVGCQTPAPGPAPSPGPMDPGEITRIFSAGRPPGDFFLHVYFGEDGRPQFSGQNRAPTGERAILLFESPAHSAVPTVRARAASGEEAVLLLDTTSRENWTNLGLRDRLGFVPLGPRSFGALPAHLFDETPGYLCVLPELTLDRMRVASVLLYARAVRDGFWPLHRHADAREAAAVMGVDFLRSFAYVTWDYASRMVLFSATTPYEADRGNVLAELPIDFDPDLGALEIPWRVDGEEGSAIFDCAGDYEVAFDAPPMDLIRQIGLQDLVFRRVRAVSPQSVGLQPVQTPYIGTALFRSYRVTLDNRRNVLWIEIPAPGPSGDEPFPDDGPHPGDEPFPDDEPHPGDEPADEE